MDKNPFFKTVIHPQKSGETKLYVGIGCVGSDNVPGQFGFELILFLWFAEQVRQALKVPSGVIHIMDKPNGNLVNVEEKIRQLSVLTRLLKAPWHIVKLSEKFSGYTWPSYEELQMHVTHELLRGGGYQVGWVYPTEMTGARDERYFAQRWRNAGGRDDVGFIFGEFPTLIPRGVPGPPYLVKKRNEDHRLLLIENPDSLIKKFTLPDGKSAMIRPGKSLAVLRVLTELGVIEPVNEKTPRFFKDKRHVAALCDGVLRLTAILQNETA